LPSSIETLQTIVREKMSPLEGTAHSYKHVDRVCRIAAFLAKKEGADLELVQAGALLHDIGVVAGRPHNETGAELTRAILEGMGYPPQGIEKVVTIVLHHPWELRDKLETLEEKIVWDADKIDLLGAVGLARGFHWLGKEPFEAAVSRAFELLPSIYEGLNTPTARTIAVNRHKRTMSFLSALKEELSLADLPTI